MARFLHTADWQIGKPFLRVADPSNRFLLQHERLAAIGRIRAVAEREEAEFVLVAGDLFDSPTVPQPAVLEVLEAIGALAVPVLAIPGNHDHGGPGSVWHREGFRRERKRRAPNLRVLLTPEPVALPSAVVLPCPLLRRAEAADPTAWIRDLAEETLPPGLPRLVLAHGGVQGFSGRDYDSDEEAPPGAANRLDLERLPAGAIDYVALGDWHNFRQVSERAWYCGTPEPDGFDRGEDNQRGQVLVVEAERGGIPRVEAVATGRLGWHRLRFHFSGDDDLERFDRRLESLLGSRVRRDLLRLEVSGSLSLEGHRRWRERIEELEHRLLRLRLKGGCEAAPRAAELAALTDRPGDPLIARVAATLRDRLEEQEADPAEAEAAAVTRLALCELHRLVTAH